MSEKNNPRKDRREATAQEDQGNAYDILDVFEIGRENGIITITEATRKAMKEVTLRIYVDDQELITVICLNRQQKELALGLLYNEGVINSINDIQNVEYAESQTAVFLRLKDGVVPDRGESLRAITASCGKCYTYIDPLKGSQYHAVINARTYSANGILQKMDAFLSRSQLYASAGAIHSVLFCAGEYELLVEDIGRHNCLDKITGILLEQDKLELAAGGTVFISGRLTSEMVMKMIRLGIPVAVSKSAPTTAAIRLARDFNITILGYVTENGGVIYSCKERITP